jgi:hypothetical protein
LWKGDNHTQAVIAFQNNGTETPSRLLLKRDNETHGAPSATIQRKSLLNTSPGDVVWIISQSWERRRKRGWVCWWE